MKVSSKHAANRYPRVLAVSAVPPWPMENGYSVRAGHFLLELTKSRRLTVVSPVPSSSVQGIPEEIKWITPEELPSTASLPWREERVVLKNRIRSVVTEHNFESAILWAGTEFLAEEISGFPPAVGDRIDCGALSTWRNAKSAEGISNTLRHIRSAVELGVYEAKVLRSLDGLVATGPDDARALRLLTGHSQIEVIPNGVAFPELDRLPDEAEDPTVIFTGVLNYEPNAEAARYFAKDIWPSVHSEIPNARFVIAGRSPIPSVKALAHRPGITIRPNVADLSKEIRKAWVAVAPMRSGSGIKNKVLEAWAVGRPVVLTGLATNGLALDKGPRSLTRLVCDDELEFAGNVVALLRQRSRRRRLGQEALTLAKKNHSWEAAGDRLGQVLSQFGAQDVDSVFMET